MANVNTGVWGGEGGQEGAGKISGCFYKDFCLFTINYRLYKSVYSHMQTIISKWRQNYSDFPDF